MPRRQRLLGEPPRINRPATAQLTLCHAYIQRVMAAWVYRRRPDDSPSDRKVMVQTAWEHLGRVCGASTHRSVSWEWMHDQMRRAVRKGIRDHAAHTHDLSISAYARFVAACQIRGIGAEWWPKGTTFNDLAEVYNTSGDDRDVARRERDHRCLDGDDLEAIAQWIQQDRAPFDADLEDLRHDRFTLSTVALDVIDGLTTIGATASPAVRNLAVAYATELAEAIASGVEPESLARVATGLGLRGGTRDRAISTVRQHLRRSLNN